MFNNLRGFLNALEERNDLARIQTEVDWNLEIGAIAQEATVRKSPALLFENIKDYKHTPGRKLLMNAYATKERLSLALGLDEKTGYRQMVETVRSRAKNVIKPRLLSSGEVKDIIHKGKEVDLLEFPVPFLHKKDGGRYVATLDIVVTKDPDSGWVNLGLYRGMLHDLRSIGLYLAGPRHGMMHAKKYYSMGKRMPVAIAIGVDPLVLMSAVAEVPVNVSEYDIAGGLKNEPVSLVKCETVDLEVPASAEIVIEGTTSLDPVTFKPEGPFGEYTGRYSGLGSHLRPVIEVSCISHQKDPIFQSTSLGNAPDLVAGDPDYISAVAFSALIWNRLEAIGVPGITGLWMDPEGVISNVFISIDNQFYGHAKWVASALWAVAPFYGKMVVVVDSDVDVYNPKKVNSAIAFRFQAERGLVINKGNIGGLDPSVDPDVLEKTILTKWDKVLLDATWPFEWQTRKEWGGMKHPPSCLADEADIENVRKRWNKYGIG
ncbi:MAG: UbiD family decarboxylase [Thermodesulfobacteriota bacterium]|nr:UbiD family decarboxylase [Thermodesulfobacteriota bacterium]